MKLLKNWYHKWSFIIVGTIGIIFLATMILTGCGSAVRSSSNRDRSLDPIIVETVKNGTIVAIIDDYHIYRFRDGEVVCYFAFEPGYGDNSIDCVK